MRYLIDGYNLMFALGMLGRRRHGHREFVQARDEFLRRIAAGHDPGGDVTVVFDGRKSPGGPRRECVHGLEIVYAPDEEADDVIERLILADTGPRHLVVVSGDRRLRTAARRRGAVPLNANDYFDHLDRLRRLRPPDETAAAEKPEPPGPAETDEWLRLFGSVEIPPLTRRRRP